MKWVRTRIDVQNLLRTSFLFLFFILCSSLKNIIVLSRVWNNRVFSSVWNNRVLISSRSYDLKSSLSVSYLWHCISSYLNVDQYYRNRCLMYSSCSEKTPSCFLAPSKPLGWYCLADVSVHSLMSLPAV